MTEQAPEHHAKQSFHHSHAAFGAAHWVRQAGILAPLIIGEFVPDADKRWRYTRIASVLTALVSEGLYTAHVHKHREEAKAREEDRCPA